MLYVTVVLVSLFAFLTDVTYGLAAWILVGVLAGIALGIVLLVLSLVLLHVTIRVYYRFRKSGIVLWVREGNGVYAFIDRNRIRVANQLYRSCSDAREERLRMLGHP